MPENNFEDSRDMGRSSLVDDTMGSCEPNESFEKKCCRFQSEKSNSDGSSDHDTKSFSDKAEPIWDLKKFLGKVREQVDLIQSLDSPGQSDTSVSKDERLFKLYNVSRVVEDGLLYFEDHPQPIFRKNNSLQTPDVNGNYGGKEVDIKNYCKVCNGASDVVKIMVECKCNKSNGAFSAMEVRSKLLRHSETTSGTSPYKVGDFDYDGLLGDAPDGFRAPPNSPPDLLMEDADEERPHMKSMLEHWGPNENLAKQWKEELVGDLTFIVELSMNSYLIKKFSRDDLKDVMSEKALAVCEERLPAGRVWWFFSGILRFLSFGLIGPKKQMAIQY